MPIDDRPPPPRHIPPPPAASPGPYDWARFGRHRLRAPEGILIDLAVTPAPVAVVWVATLWPDAASPAGWARQLWQPDPSRHGWRLPGQLAAGDVVEFGADRPDRPVRWYGIIDSFLNELLTIQGPYPHPAAAHDEAQRLLGAARFLPALQPAAPRAHSRRCHRRPW